MEDQVLKLNWKDYILNLKGELIPIYYRSNMLHYTTIVEPNIMILIYNISIMILTDVKMIGSDSVERKERIYLL